MAGESPDKSEQQKSSGETTPGERDPRLAVARSAGAPTQGRADQPTAVFRTLPSEPSEPSEPSDRSESSRPVSSGTDGDRDRDRRTDRGRGRDRDGDGDTGGDASGSVSGSGAETGSVASDGRPSGDDDERAPDDGDRLREAVTAWLSGADEGAQGSAKETAEAEAGDGGATDEGTPEVARSAPEAVGDGGKKPTAPAPRRSVDGETSAGSDADAGDPSDRSGRGGRGEGGDENGSGDGAGARTPRWAASRTAERNAAAASDAAAEGPADTTGRVAGAVASAGVARAGEGEEGDDAADRPPVARKAPPRPAVDQPTTALKVPPTPVAPRQSAESSTAAARSGSERTGSERTGSERTGSERTGSERTGSERTGSESAGSEREAERTTALRVTAPPGGPVKTERKPAAKPVAEPEDRPGPAGATGSKGPSGGAGASGAAPATGAASASTSKAMPKAVPEPASAPEPPPGSASGAKAASAPTSASSAASKAASTSEPASESTSEPASEPASGRTSGGAPEGASESAAERTSTFVPLRRDDVRPAASAPKPAASAAKPAPPAAKPAVPGGYATPSPSSLTEPERTRQQPLPPKPPLDLLAELTNTPPPPQTPVRTVLRRVRIWTPLVVLLLIVFAVVQTLRPLPEPTLSLTAEPTYAFEGAAPQLPWPAKGQAYMAASGLGTLGSSGEQKPVPIASVTKAMTAYVILKNHPLKPGEAGPMIEIDAKGESDGQLDKTDNESTLNTVKKGDKISLRDALAAIMIPSANNIARQLARWDSGSEKAFVEKMNAAAEELGMKNTTYTDPSGLDATTVSTAEDQVKLGLKLVEIKALMDITKLPEWTDPSGKTWRNYNELPPYNGALGIKTGSTTKAGGNLLFAAHKMVGDTDQLIVGAVLAQYDTPILGTAINASKELMLATQDALKNATIVKKGQVVGVVEDGLGGSVPVVATKDVRAVGWSGLTVKLELTNGDKVLPHEAPPGTVVGSLTVGEGASQVAVPVALQQELAEPGFGARLTRLG